MCSRFLRKLAGAARENTPVTVWEGYLEEPSMFGGGKPRREGRTRMGSREHRGAVTGLDPTTLIASGNYE